jgi:ABC-type polysaccharide/polyol phosphate export permease
MDWIFEGDNAKLLLHMLATQANNSALTKKSIRIFVDLMWSKYQAAIIKFIFVPYIAYLMVLSSLSGFVCGEFVLILYEDLEDE